MGNITYSFLVSSDEIMFLKLEIQEKRVLDERVLMEPWLHYSEPIKFSDDYNEEPCSVTVRMALLYLFWLIVQNDREEWCLPDEMGKSLNYFVFTKENEDWVQRRPGERRGLGKPSRKASSASSSASSEGNPE